MFRLLGMVIAIFCTATVLTGFVALAVVWGQGNLTRESGENIIAILKGEPITVDEESLEKQQEMPSYDDIVKARAAKILSISARESELAIFQQAIEDQVKFITSKRGELEANRKTFRDELKQEREKIASEAVVQARGILLKMEPESAVEKLLTLDVTDAVVLLKGMPEKDAARVLDQFRQRINGNDPITRTKKAEEIYKAIYKGSPLIEPVEKSLQAMENNGAKATELR